jgi:hypothetical protein
MEVSTNNDGHKRRHQTMCLAQNYLETNQEKIRDEEVNAARNETVNLLQKGAAGV